MTEIVEKAELTAPNRKGLLIATAHYGRYEIRVRCSAVHHEQAFITSGIATI